MGESDQSVEVGTRMDGEGVMILIKVCEDRTDVAIAGMTEPEAMTVLIDIIRSFLLKDEDASIEKCVGTSGDPAACGQRSAQVSSAI